MLYYGVIIQLHCACKQKCLRILGRKMQCQFQFLALTLLIFVAHSVRAQTFAAGQGWNFGDSFGALADDPIAKNVLYTDEEDPWRRCPQPYTLIGMQCLF